MKDKSKKELISNCLLLLIGAIAYHRWLNFSAFTFADYGFGFKQALVNYIFPGAGGIFGFNVLLWRYPFMVAYGFLGFLGFDSNVVEKLLVFWPVAFLAPISSYLLVRKITKSTISAIIGAFVFSYSTYFLSINTQGHVLLPLAYAWAVFAIHTFINTLEKKKLYWAFLTSILLLIVGSIDLRSLYVTVMVLGLYAVYHQFFVEPSWRTDFGKNIFRVFLIFFLLLIYNIYWIFPAFALSNLSSGDVFYSQLFGGEFYNIQNSLAFFYPFWSGKETTWLFLQKIPFHFWLYPILAFLGLITSKKNKQLIFFGVIALIGIFLSKQEAQPFTQVYPWLYHHILGFAAFREASKFDFLIAISYAVLIGSFAGFILRRFADRRRITIAILFLLALLPLWNTKPYITGEIKSLFVPKQIPLDYKLLDEFFSKQKSYTKVFAINHNKYWAFDTSAHPVIELEHSVKTYWRDTGLSTTFKSTQTGGQNIIDFLSSQEGRRLLSSASVGYLVVYIEDKETNNSIRRDLGENRDFFESGLGKIDYLTRLDLGMQNTLLFKNTEVKPLVYSTNEKESLKEDVQYQKVDFKVVNPTEFTVSLKNVSRPLYINSASIFSHDWVAHLGSFNWFHVLFVKDYFLPEKFHFKNAVSENSYLIDPAYIKSHYDKSSFKENSDGSIDVDLTLYFRPQSYLYLGLIISTSVLIGITSTLIYLIWKDRRKKRV